MMSTTRDFYPTVDNIRMWADELAKWELPEKSCFQGELQFLLALATDLSQKMGTMHYELGQCPHIDFEDNLSGAKCHECGLEIEVSEER